MVDEAKKEHERALSRERNRRYREANKEKIRARLSKWHEENKEHVESYRRRYYAENKEVILERNKKYKDLHLEETRESKKRWYLNNEEQTKESARRWAENNPIKVIVTKQNYRARKFGFGVEMKPEDMEVILRQFDHKCALTGDDINLSIDHVIPLSFGIVGNVPENVVPLRFDLNSSKNNRNIFVWFEGARGQYGLSQDKFDNLIKYLAEVNGMSPKEFRDYYDAIYEEQANKNE